MRLEKTNYGGITVGDYGQETFFQFFIRYCAPTMASLKCANMMSCPNTETCRMDLREIQEELKDKGIRVRVMYENDRRMLVLVYRPALLEKRMRSGEIRAFLKEYGYEELDVEDALDRLQARILSGAGSFPHEIGVFLGCPLEDIRGFIENNGKNGLCCGEWKVYHEPEKALKIFANLKKCRDIYLSLFSNGTRTLMQLTVAA